MYMYVNKRVYTNAPGVEKGCSMLMLDRRDGGEEDIGDVLMICENVTKCWFKVLGGSRGKHG